MFERKEEDWFLVLENSFLEITAVSLLFFGGAAMRCGAPTRRTNARTKQLCGPGVGFARAALV
jgi:hypothetical protein